MYHHHSYRWHKTHRLPEQQRIQHDLLHRTVILVYFGIALVSSPISCPWFHLARSSMHLPSQLGGPPSAGFSCRPGHASTPFQVKHEYSEFQETKTNEICEHLKWMVRKHSIKITILCCLHIFNTKHTNDSWLKPQTTTQNMSYHIMSYHIITLYIILMWSVVKPCKSNNKPSPMRLGMSQCLLWPPDMDSYWHGLLSALPHYFKW